MSNNYQNQGQGNQSWSGYQNPSNAPQYGQQPQQPQYQQYGQQYGQQQPVQQYVQQPNQQYSQNPVQQRSQQFAMQYGQMSAQPYNEPMQHQGQQQQITTTTTTSNSNIQHQAMGQQAMGQQQPMDQQYHALQQQPVNSYQALMKPLPDLSQQKIQDDISRVLKSAAQYQAQIPAANPETKPERESNTSTTTTTTTAKTTKTSRNERWEGEKAGGEARKRAEAKGGRAVSNFEESVALILEMFVPACDAERWYCQEFGYLCSDGLHVVYHEDIDLAVQRPGRHMPTVLHINTWLSQSAMASGRAAPWHPPNVDFWQPMHRVHKAFIDESYARGCTDLGGPRHDCPCTDKFKKADPYDADRRLAAQGFNIHAEEHTQAYNRLGLSNRRS